MSYSYLESHIIYESCVSLVKYKYIKGIQTYLVKETNIE
jgi:hypothetical protein